MCQRVPSMKDRCIQATIFIVMMSSKAMKCELKTLYILSSVESNCSSLQSDGLGLSVALALLELAFEV